MYRRQTGQWLRFGAVALVSLVAVFFLTPPAVANVPGAEDDHADGLFMERGPGGTGGQSTGGGGQSGESDDGGDSTDPDWFENNSWSDQRLTIGPGQLSYGYVNSPFDRVVNWLLQLVSSQYLRLW